MVDGRETRISLLSGARNAWLSLRGTILTVREIYWSREQTIDIPIELVSFSEQRRLKGSRLIAALLSILLFPGIGGATLGVFYLLRGGLTDHAISVCMGTSTVLGLVAFLIQFIRFWFPQPTVTLRIDAGEIEIPFWLQDRNRSEIRETMDEVRSRKASIGDTVPHPMSFVIGDTLEQPWKRTVALAFSFSIPAIVTEIPWLLLASAIPVGTHVLREIALARRPAEYRRALRRFLRRQHGEARDLLAPLVEERPDDIPARLLLVECHLRLDDFSEADRLLAMTQHALDTDTLQSIQQDIVLRRRLALRKESASSRPARG